MRTIPLSLSLTLCIAGCAGDRHLSTHHSESYLKAFATQAPSKAKPAEAVVGLDAQEAAITTENYRATLAPKGAAQYSPEPMVVVAPPTREQPMRLAPSVPKE